MGPTRTVPARDARQRGWARGGFFLHAWWPVLAFVAWSIHERVQAKYFVGLLTASGIEHAPSLRDVLFLYRGDLLLFGVAVPLATAAGYRWLRASRATAIVAAAIVALQILLYVNLQSWGQVGSFLSWQGLVNAVSFGLTNPEFIGEYLTLRGIAKLAALLLASAAVLALGWRWRGAVGRLRAGAAAGYAGVVVCLALAAAGYTSKLHAAPISDSFVANAVRALLSLDGAPPPQPMPAAALGAEFAALSNVAQHEFRGPNYGVQRGSNLLLFILETGSIEFLDVRQGVPAYAALDALRGHLYRAANHFSSFPASAESNLSILTGLYPPRAIYGTCLIDIPRQGRHLAGPIASLREQGYATALYAPFRSQVPADKVVFEGAGFERVVYGDALGAIRLADEHVFARLLADVKTWSASRQRFAAAYLPQWGHGPWSPELGATVKERGSRLVERQMQWLGEIIEVLRANGALEDTVIVLTGDHGVRTTSEDPRVKVGMIDWYSLQVPLLLYAPKADLTAVDPMLPSSHVDLPAELAQLFGLGPLPGVQGLPLDHPQRAQRRQFMMAGWYYGANGFRDREGAAMYSDLLDAVYERRDRVVDFGMRDLVTDAAERGRVRQLLGRMAALQESWIVERACATALPDRPLAAARH
ncbi:MAG: hypothetical protein AMXMBFR66_08470 [Pseudomonadota bacterium]